MKLPPLRAVHCFEVVARNLSFSLAAEELNVTQSAVSHQIRLLEDYLGESLFIRQGRKLSLSDSGARYLEDISPAISSIAMASQKVREGDKGSIRLAIYSSLAVKWLIPRLADFKRLYPEIDLTLNMVAGDPEQTDSVGDCFITVQRPKRNYMAVKLYAETLYPVCSHKIWKEIQDQSIPTHCGNIPFSRQILFIVNEGKIGPNGAKRVVTLYQMMSMFSILATCSWRSRLQGTIKASRLPMTSC